MRNNTTECPRWGLDSSEVINGFPNPGKTVVKKAPDKTLNHSGHIEEKTGLVTGHQITECQTLEREPTIVKVPIEYLAGEQAFVFEVPIHPWSRQSDVMATLSKCVPQLDELELWCWPRSQALCKDAHVYELAVVENQHLLLRRKPGLFERFRQRIHDRGVLNVTRPCSCL